MRAKQWRIQDFILGVQQKISTTFSLGKHKSDDLFKGKHKSDDIFKGEHKSDDLFLTKIWHFRILWGPFLKKTQMWLLFRRYDPRHNHCVVSYMTSWWNSVNRLFTGHICGSWTKKFLMKFFCTINLQTTFRGSEP